MNTGAAWIVLIGIVIATLCAIGVAYCSGRKQDIANDDLEYVEDMAGEYEQGIVDNQERLLWLIHMIKNNYTLSIAQTARLDRVRRMLRRTTHQLSG
jgi:hypothetical protein